MLRASDALRSMTPSTSTADLSARVGVVGPGLMGLGIAQAFAAAGADVVLCGRDEDASRRGRERLAASLSGRSRVAGSTPPRRPASSRRSEPAAIDSGLRTCDLVIESVPEDRALKNDVLAAIEKAAPNAILASNTSGLAIGGLAQAFADPSRFLGLHFFSPAERMPLVEVVAGPQTAEAVVRKRAGPRPRRRQEAGARA